MQELGSYDNIHVELEGHVALVEMRRPPYNFIDVPLARDLADAFEALDGIDQCRAIVLASEGKAFCAGGAFADPDRAQDVDEAETAPSEPRPDGNPLYVEAVRLFAASKPAVAAVQGAAVGAGLGLSLVADFRVAGPDARFVANFTRLGFHPGFGLTVTLPEAIGKTNAQLMFYTSRRFKAEEAKEMGLVQMLVPQDQVRAKAMELASEIAECAPLGNVATRKTLRGDLAARVRAATDHEAVIQAQLRQTQDYQEGVKAMAERRVPNFINA